MQNYGHLLRANVDNVEGGCSKYFPELIPVKQLQGKYKERVYSVHPKIRSKRSWLPI